MNRGFAYDPAIDTYAVSTIVTLAASCTDFFTLVGSPTKTVLITEILLMPNQTAAGGQTVFVIKRSADNTGGTSSLITPIPLDSVDAASGAVARNYSANPAALGAAVGNLYILFLNFATATNGFVATTLQPVYQRKSGEKGITLRGVNEVLALNLGAATSAGGVMRLHIRWVEF